MALTAKKVYAILSKRIRDMGTPPEVDLSNYYNKIQVDTKFEELTELVQMSAADTTANLLPNKLYVFPEMSELTINLPMAKIVTYREYHFIFTSGATATVLTLPENVKSDLAVEPNRIYECSIVENLLAWTSWAV